MKGFKRALIAVLAAVMTVSLFVACETVDDGSDVIIEPPAKTQYALEISDLLLEKGEEREITYQLKPVGKLSVLTLDILTATPSGCVKIEDHTLRAVKGGTATIRAVATNIEGAAVEFSAETTFTVSVAASEIAEVSDIAVCGVSAVKDPKTGLPTVELEYEVYNTLVAVKDNARSLVTGTLAEGASFRSVTFDDTSDTVRIVIAAENGTDESTYLVKVRRYIEAVQHEMAIVNPGFDQLDENYVPVGWSFENLKTSCTSSAGDTSNKKNNPTNPDGTANTRGVQGWGNVPEEGKPSRIYQTVSNSRTGGFVEGDYVIVSAWVSTRYGTSVSSLKLFAGNQSVEMSELDPDWQYQKVSWVFRLTAEDITDGKVTFGIEFTQLSGKWINIDDISLVYAERLYYTPRN